MYKKVSILPPHFNRKNGMQLVKLLSSNHYDNMHLIQLPSSADNSDDL